MAAESLCREACASHQWAETFLCPVRLIALSAVRYQDVSFPERSGVYQELIDGEAVPHRE